MDAVVEEVVVVGAGFCGRVLVDGVDGPACAVEF